MPATPQAAARGRRLTRSDVMRQLSDDALQLASRIETPARSLHEAEDRIAEGERISASIRKLVRG